MRRAFLFGLAASAAAGAIMLLFRMAVGGLTLPEALVDGVTAVVPVSVFSAILAVLGVWAKRLLVIALTIALLAAGGGVGLLWHWWSASGGRRPASTARRWWRAVVLGLVLWGLSMAVVLPISGRGFFGLSQGPWPTALALVWLASSLAYSLVLAALHSEATAPAPAPEAAVDVTRRLLLKRLTWTAVGLVAAAALGASLWRLLSATSRRAISSLMGGKLTPEVIPNGDFYQVSKDLINPSVNAASWKLEVGGLVEHTLTLDYEGLKALPATTQYLTLECISNEVGGDLIGNALWKGVRLRDLLAQAGVKSGAMKVVLRAADGYSDSIKVDKAIEQGTLLAYEMNGVPLPADHGFPARLLVPDIYGMKNVKWLTGIELVDYDFRGYWQERGWSDVAVIKTMSRIDDPSGEYSLRELEAAGGQATLGGIAFGGARGISRVEVSADGGNTWSPAQLQPALSPYTWVLWTYQWRPPGQGEYILAVRAADGKGELQTADEVGELPDGASGYHKVFIRLIQTP